MLFASSNIPDFNLTLWEERLWIKTVSKSCNARDMSRVLHKFTQDFVQNLSEQRKLWGLCGTYIHKLEHYHRKFHSWWYFRRYQNIIMNFCHVRYTIFGPNFFEHLKISSKIIPGMLNRLPGRIKDRPETIEIVLTLPGITD